MKGLIFGDFRTIFNIFAKLIFALKFKLWVLTHPNNMHKNSQSYYYRIKNVSDFKIAIFAQIPVRSRTLPYTPYDPVWPSMSLYVPVWLIWSYMFLCSPIQPHMALQDPFCFLTYFVLCSTHATSAHILCLFLMENRVFENPPSQPA